MKYGPQNYKTIIDQTEEIINQMRQRLLKYTGQKKESRAEKLQLQISTKKRALGIQTA